MKNKEKKKKKHWRSLNDQNTRRRHDSPRTPGTTIRASGLQGRLQIILAKRRRKIIGSRNQSTQQNPRKQRGNLKKKKEKKHHVCFWFDKGPGCTPPYLSACSASFAMNTCLSRSSIPLLHLLLLASLSQNGKISPTSLCLTSLSVSLSFSLPCNNTINCGRKFLLRGSERPSFTAEKLSAGDLRTVGYTGERAVQVLLEETWIRGGERVRRFRGFNPSSCSLRQSVGPAREKVVFWVPERVVRTRGFHRIRILEMKPRARLGYRGPLDPTAGRRVKAKWWTIVVVAGVARWDGDVRWISGWWHCGGWTWLYSEDSTGTTRVMANQISIFWVLRRSILVV